MTQRLQLAHAERAMLLILAGVQFCHVLDFMIMMPLGPFLISALSITTDEFALLVASYSFSAAAAGLLIAPIVDRFERKRFLLAIFAAFAVATLLCALSPGFLTLLIARGLAGVFGGMMGALVHTMVADAIPFERRAKATGYVATAFSVSSIAGVPFSLLLADALGWQAPFVLITLISAGLIWFGYRALPDFRAHLDTRREARAIRQMLRVAVEPNHLRAMMLTCLVILGGFTVIPYITLYTIANVGIASNQIPAIYFLGGAATLITARFIGAMADRFGKVMVFRIVAIGACIPVLLVTTLAQVSLVIWLAVTTLFFVLVSGRMVPLLAIVGAAVKPQARGTFLSLNATVQSMAMGLASMVGGVFITQSPDGFISGYGWVGLVAASFNVMAAVWVGRVTIHEGKPS
ncbi:MAG: MFS transporter [Rhodocyclaceae bacterium]|nr:MFS transporter [Rhodocyclaceae bacterium]